MNVNHILKDPRTHYGIGAVVGVGISYIYNRRRAKQVVVVPAEEDAQQMALIHERARTPFIIDDEVLQAKNEMLVIIPGDDPEFEDVLKEEAAIIDDAVKVNVFTNPNNDWDYEQELTSRDPEGPYIISYEEYIADEMGYHQETVTYYSGDDIMADTTDTPIYNYAGLMGELRFGHGSNDPNVVYIRNEKIHMEWEVLLHTSSFSEEVLGQHMEAETENELRHSVLKFRRD